MNSNLNNVRAEFYSQESFLGSAILDIFGEIVTDAANFILDYETKGAVQDPIGTFKKIAEFVKIKLKYVEDEEVASTIDSFLLKHVILIKKSILEKHIKEEKSEEFNNLLNKIWKENYKEIGKDAYIEQLIIEPILTPINKMKDSISEAKRNNQNISITNKELEKFFESSIKILEKIKKTNNIASKIVKEYKEINLVSKYDQKKLDTSYSDALYNKQLGVFNKLFNLNIDHIVFEDKKRKLMMCYKDNNQLRGFLNKNIIIPFENKDQVIEEIKKDTNRKIEKWKKRINSSFNNLFFDTSGGNNKEMLNLPSNLVKDTTISDIPLKEQESNLKKRIKEVKKLEIQAQKEQDLRLSNPFSAGM